ncbi:BLUF domain-containing protein [Sphingomonas sp. BIUV-7]|uniref:BLUF domain-containing protein n=1 Tax=Sphingomonas natans TaxID=3063330 RepID=A0ABT8Y511_9SPHN|nr:BLUF domain-containing protein [Sphingomonas sp. BIUV-7]MDO6413416.1 BLUF domain-containing protein [Sphingomonas sp. BIUV-7]
MLQLTYISSAVGPCAESDVDAILKTARRNNVILGVTGLLLFDGRRFLQTLEGETASVNAAYQRIRNDPRHRAIVQLSSKETKARAFGDWAMAAQCISAGPGVVAQVDALTETVADPNLRETFRGFARVRAAALTASSA